jgi:hypothetical protein
MIDRLQHGTISEKVQMGLRLGTWFCIGAFAASVVFPHIDNLVASVTAASSSLAAVVGGSCAAGIAYICKAV